MSEAARIDLVDRAPLTEKQQNVYESIMQYQRVNGYAPTIREICKMVGGIDFKCLCTSENIRRKRLYSKEDGCFQSDSNLVRKVITLSNKVYVDVLAEFSKDGLLIPKQMLLQMFRTMLLDNTELSDEKINELVDTFMNTVPDMLKTQLQAA